MSNVNNRAIQFELAKCKGIISRLDKQNNAIKNELSIIKNELTDTNNFALYYDNKLFGKFYKRKTTLNDSIYVSAFVFNNYHYDDVLYVNIFSKEQPSVLNPDSSADTNLYLYCQRFAIHIDKNTFNMYEPEPITVNGNKFIIDENAEICCGYNESKNNIFVAFDNNILTTSSASFSANWTNIKLPTGYVIKSIKLKQLNTSSISGDVIGIDNNGYMFHYIISSNELIKDSLVPNINFNVKSFDYDDNYNMLVCGYTIDEDLNVYTVLLHYNNTQSVWSIIDTPNLNGYYWNKVTWNELSNSYVVTYNNLSGGSDNIHFLISISIEPTSLSIHNNISSKYDSIKIIDCGLNFQDNDLFAIGYALDAVTKDETLQTVSLVNNIWINSNHNLSINDSSTVLNLSIVNEQNTINFVSVCNNDNLIIYTLGVDLIAYFKYLVNSSIENKL